MRKLICTMGISGSGKSYWVKQKFSSCDDILILDSDDLREQWYGKWNDQSHNSELFQRIRQLAIEGLKNNQTVVICATNLNSRKRFSLLHDCGAPFKNLLLSELVVFNTSYELANFQNFSRARQVPQEVLQRQLTQFQLPLKYEGWTKITLVENPYGNLQYELDQKLHAFGDQKNPHHSLTLYDHCLKTYKLWNQKYPTANFYSQYAAYYHDIGKLFTQSIDRDGIAHYYGHENVGAYLVLNLTNSLSAATLVNYHMKPYAPELEKTLWRDRAGEQLWQQLLMLHECDELAH